MIAKWKGMSKDCKGQGYFFLGGKLNRKSQCKLRCLLTWLVKFNANPVVLGRELDWPHEADSAFAQVWLLGNLHP